MKVKLAYVEQEKALEIEKLIQEQKMEELKLKRDLKLSRAKLNVFDDIEKEQMPSLEDDLANLPSEGKGESVKRFLQSLPVTTVLVRVAHQFSYKYLKHQHLQSRPHLNPRQIICVLLLHHSLQEL